jgi:hypothetical protein
MSDETEARSAGATDDGRHPQGGRSVGSPFQARAAFIKNWDWESIVSINRGACQRGRAQHGANSETEGACAKAWEDTRGQELTLAATLDFLLWCHRRAPFLFFNGNTFATIGRELALALFSDLPPCRKRETSSAIAHYIAGVLDRESMVEIVGSLCESAELQPGDRVKTLRGTTRGVIQRILPDGRVVWTPVGSKSELVALPESLLKMKEPSH